ncbi:hypothetical protein C8N37_107150 [Sphingobacterium faecium]|jgi:hypothetical protein|nr:hypothetical protein C8N37_107150 [Sphingobacterium faecium]
MMFRRKNHSTFRPNLLFFFDKRKFFKRKKERFGMSEDYIG